MKSELAGGCRSCHADAVARPPATRSAQANSGVRLLVITVDISVPSASGLNAPRFRRETPVVSMRGRLSMKMKTFREADRAASLAEEEWSLARNRLAVDLDLADVGPAALTVAAGDHEVAPADFVNLAEIHLVQERTGRGDAG